MTSAPDISREIPLAHQGIENVDIVACGWCQRIRMDGVWSPAPKPVTYAIAMAAGTVTHGICPACQAAELAKAKSAKAAQSAPPAPATVAPALPQQSSILHPPSAPILPPSCTWQDCRQMATRRDKWGSLYCDACALEAAPYTCGIVPISSSAADPFQPPKLNLPIT
jgi:hypothetical protein